MSGRCRCADPVLWLGAPLKMSPTTTHSRVLPALVGLTLLTRQQEEPPRAEAPPVAADNDRHDNQANRQGDKHREAERQRQLARHKREHLPESGHSSHWF